MSKLSIIYKLVRFVPNIESGEFANIAVISLIPEQKKLSIDFKKGNEKRINDFFNKDCADQLNSSIESLSNYVVFLQSKMESLKTEQEAYQLFHEVTKKTGQSIDYSNQRSALNKTGKDILDKL